jgi:sporulation-control protein
VHVILEADKRAGLLRAGGDAYGRFAVTHEQAVGTDWTATINQWMSQVSGSRW